MALLSVNGTSINVTANLQGTANAYTTQPADVNATANASTVKKSVAFALGGNAANSINQIVSSITTVNTSSNASVDLTNLTNICGTSSVNCVRVKGLFIRLLSTSDDASNGTACTSITINNTVTNSFAAASHTGWFDNGSEGAAGGSKFTIPNGGAMLFLTPAAAGVAVAGATRIINYVNNDATNTAAVETTVFAADA